MRPVFGNDGCIGYLLRTPRGWRVFSVEGELFGYVHSERDGLQALLAENASAAS